MEKTESYKRIAQREIEKLTGSIPAHTGTTASIVHQLDVVKEVLTQLDRALIKEAKEFTEKYELTDEEAELIYEINAASLAALMARTNVPLVL